MDISGSDTNIEPPKQSEDTVNYRVPNILPNNVTNVDSFCPSIWDQPILNMLPHNSTHFPSDYAFIERAARFSCFNGGSFSEMLNPFTVPDPFNPQMVVKSHDEAKNGVGLLGNRSDEGEFSGSGEQEESGKGIVLKKRKRIEKKNEHNEKTCVEKAAEIRQNEESEHGGKNGKQEPKEDYIHVRARRGQATNSHSLAERLRREKISERMKLLQDLVPGCSKVTGKAVMLDEIINYVQSLQRQVEFLSMKLATVNPRMDFNVEGLIAKDILRHRTGLSSSMPFSHDMTMMTPPFQSTVNVCGGLRQPSPQAPSVWDDEIHNVFHNGFNSSSPPNMSQDLTVSLPGHTKDEI